ncbi:MAG: hypothetical protein GXO82_04330 [Chlorobi bacterium]|nr:hypothetical protein [Chlorobiota bacterium]
MKRVIPAYRNLSDILQDACDKESDAEQFYREAADMALDPGIRSFLLRLADMEKDHYHMLRTRLEKLKAEQSAMAGIISSYCDGS